MIKVLFVCTEIQNNYEEEFEFPDGTTEEAIEEEYKQWVWEQIGDQFHYIIEK